MLAVPVLFIPIFLIARRFHCTLQQSIGALKKLTLQRDNRDISVFADN